MALVPRPPNPIRPRYQPPDWAKILTRDPVERNYWAAEGWALWVTLFGGWLIFGASLALIRPFLLLYYATEYPNLASVAFTSASWAAAGLALAVTGFLLFRYREFFARLAKWAAILIAMVAALLVGWFFFLLGTEAFLWMMVPDGFQRLVAAVIDFLH
jgi:hypothetical protein